MRTHRRYALWISQAERERTAPLVAIANLAAARLEPVVSQDRQMALLDLVFSDGKDAAVVPALEVSYELLLERENSPLVWPHALLAGVAPEVTDAIEQALLPWLEALSFNRSVNGEVIKIFGGEREREDFERARMLRFVGAAPYAQALTALAPYVYAARFARRKRTGLRDPYCASGAALLARHAISVRADLGNAADNELAGRWYGNALFGELEDGYDLVCGDAGDAPVRVVLDGSGGTPVTIASPVPVEILVSFDTEDSPRAAGFGIECAPERAFRESAATAFPLVGGSHGRVALALRDGYDRLPDADVDEAAALAVRLRAEGFDVEMNAFGACDVSAFDLIHAFGTSQPLALRSLLQRARASHKPAVLTPLLAGIAGEPAWGEAIVRKVLRASYDETTLADHLMLMESRKLEAPGVTLAAEPFANFDAAVREVVGMAQGVVGGLPALPGAVEPGRLESLLGTGEFVLAHAPVAYRCNQFLLVRAAAEAGLPLVIAGPVAEMDYYSFVRAIANENVAFVPEPGAAMAEALYRSARVFADISWYRLGRARLVRAALSGCAIALTHAGALSEWQVPVWEADPAGERSISLALRDAWQHAGEARAPLDAASARIAAWARASDPLVAAVQSYAAALQTVASAT